MGWIKVAEPQLRSKEHPQPQPNLDSKVRGFGGLTTADVGVVRIELGKKLAHIWFQDVGWQAVSFAPLSIVDFDAFLHTQNGVPRLKLWLAEWPDTSGGHPNTVILDTGWEYR